MTTNKDAFNRAEPNVLATLLHRLRLGDVLVGQLPQVLRMKTPVAAQPYNLSTLSVLTLPDDAKAAFIYRANARSGTVATGDELTVQAFATTPATTQIAVAPNGNIVVLTTDTIDQLDVIYQPERGEMVELFLSVSSNALTIPSKYTARGVILLSEAEALAGTSAGKKIVLVPAASAAAGRACLNVAKTQVVFNGTDAITRARVKILVKPDIGSTTGLPTDLDDLLRRTEEFI